MDHARFLGLPSVSVTLCVYCVCVLQFSCAQITQNVSVWPHFIDGVAGTLLLRYARMHTLGEGRIPRASRR